MGRIIQPYVIPGGYVDLSENLGYRVRSASPRNRWVCLKIGYIHTPTSLIIKLPQDRKLSGDAKHFSHNQMPGASLFIRHGQEAANDIGPQALGRFGRQLDAVLQHWHWEVCCGPDIGFP